MPKSMSYPKIRVVLQATLLDENNNAVLGKFAISEFEPAMAPGASDITREVQANEDFGIAFAAACDSFNNSVRGKLNL